MCVHEEQTSGRRGNAATIVTYEPGLTPVFGVAIFPAHPELGGDGTHRLLRVLAESAAHHGALVLRIAYPPEAAARSRPEGCRLSDDRLQTLADGCRGPLDHFTRRAAGLPIFGFGHSLGAYLVLLLAETWGIQDPVLVSPPLVRQGALPAVRHRRTLLLAAEEDTGCPPELARACSAPEPGSLGIRIVPRVEPSFRGNESLVARATLAHWGMAASFRSRTGIVVRRLLARLTR